MRKHNFAFIDIETTGLNIIRHEIIEIGCVLTTPSLEVIDEFELKIKPKNIEIADPVALKINHYNSKDWESAVSLEEAIKIFADKTEDTVMVGHNISFDASFLDKAFYETGIKKKFFHYHLLDTVSIAFTKLHDNEEIDRFTLHELCQYFGIENKKEHTALSDARADFELYKKLMSL